MTLEQLRVFVAVAERQHVRRAAEALNLAQSAASAAIAALESAHQTKLFNRSSRVLVATAAGTSDTRRRGHRDACPDRARAGSRRGHVAGAGLPWTNSPNT